MSAYSHFIYRDGLITLEQRLPDGPLSATKILPPTTPSAPRAMATPDSTRSTKSDSAPGRDRHRDGPPISSSASTPTASSPQDSHPLGSLRSRISDSKELPRTPSTSGQYRSDPPSGRKDDDRDGGRKRTLAGKIHHVFSTSLSHDLSERDKDSSLDIPLGQGGEQSMQPPKRPRINRNRYPTSQNTQHAIARKLLPIDNEKSRARKD